MSAPAFRRTLAQASRSTSWRSSGTSSRVWSRRLMSSDAHSTKEKAKSDLPWIIGASAAVALGAGYILSPPAKKHAHKAAEAADKHVVEAIKSEKKEPGPELMKDSDGNEENVAASDQQSFQSDSPQDAQTAEEAPIPAEEKSETSFDQGSPGMNDVDGDNEIKEKPKASLDSGPVDIGDARETAKENKSPSEAQLK